MSPLESWLLWLAFGCLAVAVFVLVDMWMDRRPGGRKRDEQLEYLRSHERYRAALRRQHEQHIRLGHRENNDD